MSMYELGIVKRNIDRADKTAVETMGRLGSATVHEAQGRVGLFNTYMRPIYAGALVSGTAVTVLLHPGDNYMLHVAAEQIQPGDIVVAALTSPNTDGFFGDLLATSFMARGAGLGDRWRRARRERAHQNGLPGLEPGHQLQRHGEGDIGVCEHSCGVCRCLGQPR